MHAHEILLGHRKESEGIIVTEIFLRGEGEFREVGKRPDVVGLDARVVHLLAIGRHLLIDAMHRLLQALELDLLDLAPFESFIL